MDYETPDLLIRFLDDVTVIRLRNPNMTGTPELARIAVEIDRLLDNGATKLVLDFKYVRFVGSAALGLMIRIQKRVKLAGRKMILSHPENIADLLHVSRTASLFQLAPDLHAACKLF